MTSPDRQEPQETGKQSRLLSLVYNLKVQRIALILIPLALVMMILSQVIGEAPAKHIWSWSNTIYYIPFRSLGEAFLTIAVVAITFEWLLRRETEEKVQNWIRQALEEQRRTITVETANAVLADPGRAVSSLSAERVQQLLQACLAAELSDEKLAQDVYQGILRPTARVVDRWSKLRQRITLDRIGEESPDEIRSRYYQAHLLAQYRCVLRHSELKYLATSSIEEFEQSFNDDQYMHRWLYPPTVEFPRLSADCHRVSRIMVNNVDLHINEETTDKGGIVSVGKGSELPKLRGQLVDIEFQCELKQSKRSHTLYLSVPNPSKDVTMEIDFSGTDIWYMSVFQYFSAQGNVDIRYIPTRTKPRRIEVRVEEWVLPASGVVFTWVLQEERTKSFQSLLREFTSGTHSGIDLVGHGHGAGPFGPIDA